VVREEQFDDSYKQTETLGREWYECVPPSLSV
jgi:hypothetical protein